VMRRRGLRLDTSALDSAIAHNNGAIISPARYSDASSQDDPDNLLNKEAASEDKQEDMSGDIVSTGPVPARRSTRRSSEELLAVRRTLSHSLVRKLAFSAGKSKPAIDKGRTEAPLRDEEPPARDKRPAEGGPGDASGILEGGVRRHESDERGRYPQPPALDEEDVE